MDYPDFPVERPVTYRRYCLLKRQQWLLDWEDSAMAGVWRSQQEAVPGNALPTDFPFLASLEAGGYTTREDLDGAEAPEIQRATGLRHADTLVVLEAFDALPALPP